MSRCSPLKNTTHTNGCINLIISEQKDVPLGEEYLELSNKLKMEISYEYNKKE